MQEQELPDFFNGQVLTEQTDKDRCRPRPVEAQGFQSNDKSLALAFLQKTVTDRAWQAEALTDAICKAVSFLKQRCLQECAMKSEAGRV